MTDTFRISSASGSCLEASVRHVYMLAQAPDLKDSLVAKLVDERHAAWEADLPLDDDAALWDYLTVLEQGSRLALLAHCLSFGINALHEKMNPYGAGISASGLTRRMAMLILWPVRSISTWSRQVGSRRLMATSTACPKPGSSKPCVRRRGRGPRNSSIT